MILCVGGRINMDINQIRSEREKMENNMQRIISQMVGIFQDQTGMRVENINISMIDITNIEDFKPKVVVGNVRIELERI
jgi:hypothetical protein